MAQLGSLGEFADLFVLYGRGDLLEGGRYRSRRRYGSGDGSVDLILDKCVIRTIGGGCISEQRRCGPVEVEERLLQKRASGVRLEGYYALVFGGKRRAIEGI